MYGVSDLPRTCYEFLSAHIKNVAPRRTRSMSYVSKSMSYVCSRMYDVRVTYLSYLDTPWIRESIRDSVTALLETKEKSSIDQKITTLVTALQILDADENTLKDAKNDGRRHVMFAADAQVSKRFRDCERRFGELEKEAMKLSLSFQRSKKLGDLLTDDNRLGIFKLTEQALKIVLLERQITSRNEVNVRVTSDKNDPEITGCAFMSNGNVVICDIKL